MTTFSPYQLGKTNTAATFTQAAGSVRTIVVVFNGGVEAETAYLNGMFTHKYAQSTQIGDDWAIRRKGGWPSDFLLGVDDSANSGPAAAVAGLQVVELSGVSGTQDGDVRVCNGYAAAGDGGGGNFDWRAGVSAGADGYLKINATGGQWQRVFSGALNVRWFGATGDGTTDDAPAIRAAFTYAAGRTVTVPSGTYVLGSVAATAHFNMRWAIILGDGDSLTLESGAVLKYGDGFIDLGAGTYGAGGIVAIGRSNVSVYGPGEIDCNGANNLVGAGLTRPCYPIRFYECTDQVVEGLTIRDNPGLNSILFAGGSMGDPGARGRIVNNTIVNGGTSVTGNVEQVDYSAIYCDSTDVQIYGNKVLHDADPFGYAGGIECHGHRITCRDNYIERSYPAVFVASDHVGVALENVSVVNNVFKRCQNGIRVVGVGTHRNLTITGNRMGLFNWSPIAFEPSYGYNSLVSETTDGLVLSGNDIYDEDASTPAEARTYGIQLGDTRNARVEGNKVSDITGDAFAHRGPYVDVKFRDNILAEYGRNDSANAHAGHVLLFDSGNCTRLTLYGDTGVVTSPLGGKNYSLYNAEWGGATVDAKARGYQRSGLTVLATGTNATSLGVEEGSYSPALTAASGSPAAGDATIYGRWRRNGNWVTAHVEITFGSTTVFGATEQRFSLPFAAASGAGARIGIAQLLDVGAPLYYEATCQVAAGGAYLIVPQANNLLNATHPFTWATGDILRLSITYEAA